MAAPAPPVRIPARNGDSIRFLTAIDVGTNSIHMVVVQIETSFPAFSIVAREKEAVRLGDRDPVTGNLKPKIIRRSIDCLRRFLDLSRSIHNDRIIAVATSATREAPNGRDFLRNVKESLDLNIDLISGQEEARRIYIGVISGMEFDRKPHVIIDIGGGSTELILGDGGDPRVLTSTKVGAVRLTGEFVTTDPIDNGEYNTLKAFARGTLERPADEVRSALQPGETLQMVGTSGTIETLAKIHAMEHLGHEPSILTGYPLTRAYIDAKIASWRTMTCAQRAEIPGMSPQRAEIIVAGATVLQQAMALLGVESLVVCDRALREGLIVNWMLERGLISDRLRYHGSVRKRSVLKIARQYQVPMETSECIANLALELFDRTQGTLHDWGNEERDLFWAAAILHNCGFFISHNAHHKHSYYLIRHSELFGFTEIEVEAIANIARYHRKSPPKKKHENYINLPTKRHKQMVSQLSSLLRLAIALDRRQIGAIASVKCTYLPSRKKLLLFLHPAQPGDACELELWSLNYKKEFFEQEFGIELVASLEPVLEPA